MDQLKGYLQAFLTVFGDQPYLQAAAIAILSYFLARVISRGIPKLTGHVTQKLRLTAVDDYVAMIVSPIFWFIFLHGLGFATEPLGFPENVQANIMSVFQSIMIIIWASFLFRLIKRILRSAAEEDDKFKAIQLATLPLFENISVILIAVATVHLIFSAWNVDMTALLASAGIAGLAIGMASKDILSDILSGVLILTDGPFRIGDFVEIGKNGTIGEVTHIGIRTTRLLTRDNVEITVPNTMVRESEIKNRSGGPTTHYRIRIPLDMDYGADLYTITEAVNAACEDCDKILKDPKPKLRVFEVGGTRLQLVLLAWIERPQMKIAAVDALNQLVYQRLRAEGIELAHPKTDIYIKESPEAHQEISIKELPVGRQVVHVKEMPNLFARSAD